MTTFTEMPVAEFIGLYKKAIVAMSNKDTKNISM